MRPPPVHHENYTNKLVEDALFPQGSPPPPHMNNLPTGNLTLTLKPLLFRRKVNLFSILAHSGSTVNQLLRRAAAAALRRERNSSTHSDDLEMKRHRMSSGPISSPLDALNLPQVMAADFSTSVKHSNNNLSPHPKDRDDRHDGVKMAIGK